MTGPLVTVRHDEDADEIYHLGSRAAVRLGLDVHAELTYEPGQTEAALEAVDRLAADLRRQIADAAERPATSEQRQGRPLGDVIHDETTYATDHGFTPHTGPFANRPGEPDRCRVMLARYPCPHTREEHDPALPPVDVDVFGYRRRPRA